MTDDNFDDDDDFARRERYGRGRGRNDAEAFGFEGLFGPQGLFGAAGLLGQVGRGAMRGGGRHGHGMHGHRHGGEHGGGRRRKMFAPGELRLVLLSLTAEEPRHGYDCIRVIEEATGGAYAPSPGIVYPTLAMLADEGLIAEQASPETRKVFAVTEAGRAELAANEAEVAALRERLGQSGDRVRAAKSSDVMRALGNLASVLTNRAAAGRFNAANKEQIVDLIDELARRIEKL